MFKYLIKILLLVSFISCGPKPYGPPDEYAGDGSSDPSFIEFRTVLGKRCASCHATAEYEFSLLDTTSTYEKLGIIKAGDAENSPLHECVTKADGGTMCDSIMPPGEPLPDEEVHIIRDYINGLTN